MKTLPGTPGSTKQPSVIAAPGYIFAYIDTVEMYFRRYRPRGLLRAVHSQGCAAWFQQCYADGIAAGYRLIVHQPNVPALRLLDQHQRDHDGKLCRFDVALDLITTPQDHDALRQWIEGHAVLSWRRAGSMNAVGATLYWNTYEGKRSNRDVVLYDDRPSKITGRKCVHFELRFYNAGAIRRAGFHDASDLIELNPRELFRRHVKLLDVEPLRRRLIRRAVRADRIKVRSQRTSRITDGYRARIPDRLRSLLHRAQRVKDLYPARVARLQAIPIEVLRVPTILSWAHDNTPSTYSNPKFPSGNKEPTTQQTRKRELV